MPVTAHIALGSNLGDRADYLQRAVQLLQEHPAITVTRMSSIYETEPVGGPPGQSDYLNAVVEIETELPPHELLGVLHAIEQQLGRVRREKDGPRTIDLDLLLYGQAVLDEEGLQVPHPRLHLRSFVLEPLAEIAPDLVHPVLGVTIGKLWDDFDPDVVARSSAAANSHQPQQTHAEPLTLSTGQPLLGQRALVTGSTSGIGRAIALALAGAGVSVIIHGRREDAAETVANEVAALGVETEVLIADLSDLDQCQQLAASAWEGGPLDIWVNNAGADTLTGEAARWPFAQKLRALWEVDVRATLLLARDVGRRMKGQGHGVILNMGWDQAETGMEGDSGELFAATKGAIMAFTRSLACSLAPEVRVNCLAPGWIRTAWGSGASSTWQDRVLRETPLARWGTPEDVAAAVLWLVSPTASFITGQIIRVNGGAVR